MKVMIFCSNPVNGGTARIFYETVIGLNGYRDLDVVPCININNTVEIYKRISELYRLPIFSCRELYPHLFLENRNVIKCLFATLKRKLFYSFQIKKNVRLIRHFILNKQIEAVLIHNGSYVGDDLCNHVLKAASRCKRTKKRIMVFHNDMEKNLFSRIRYFLYDCRINSWSTRVVTVSNYTKERLLNNSFLKKNISVVYNGIEVKNALKIAPRVNARTKRILMIGNFAENKGQAYFIKMANELSHKGDYIFAIIGNSYDNVYYHKCLSLIEEYNLEGRIAILRGVNNASDYIGDYDILVVTSLRDESFGLISVEAMAYGKPVVAFACGGVPEVVKNGRNGYIVPVGDYVALSNKVNELANDQDKMTLFGKNSIDDYWSTFVPNIMNQKYYELLTEARANE